jgi:hypothetical protein
MRLDMKTELPINDDRIYINALDQQVGGSHYKTGRGGVQPVEFSERNRLPFCMANAIKYLYRYKLKGGITDLEKALHYCELAMSMHTPLGDADGWVIEPTEFAKSNKFNATETAILMALCSVYIRGLSGYIEAHKRLNVLIEHEKKIMPRSR